MLKNKTECEPVIYFKDKKQLKQYVNYWKEILGIRDWIVRVTLFDRPATEEEGNILGRNFFNICEESATIEIFEFSEADERTTAIKYCQEYILVHELLHCRFNKYICDSAEKSTDKFYIDGLHATMDSLARSFIMAKYNLNLEWFLEE